MRRSLICIFFLISISGKTQFDSVVARDMIAICNSYTFSDLYNSDSIIIPSVYKKVYTSPVVGMDNVFQVYTNGNTAVINIRGSTAKKSSWLENFYSAMIPATGTMKVGGENFNYCFAKDSGACVHAGYALGIAFLRKEFIAQIQSINRMGIYDFVITGHSQGGALSNMLLCYLENVPEEQLSKKNKFRVYSFAAPMTGNLKFTNEYYRRFETNASSFNIVNHSDPIPSFPLSYNDTNFLSGAVKSLLFDRGNFSFKKAVLDGMANLLAPGIRYGVKKSGSAANGQIVKELGEVELPPYVKDINYCRMKNRIELAEFEFPKMLKDSSILQNKELMAKLKRKKNGDFADEDLYVKQPWTYQHKPYNYYVAVLKKYFPKDYEALKCKYLPENVERKRK